MRAVKGGLEHFLYKLLVSSDKALLIAESLHGTLLAIVIN
jgi:hypothetical protein